MKHTMAAIAIVLLAGCGLDAAGSAATSAALKKQQMEQGKKTLEAAQRQIDKGVELQQERIDSATEAAGK
jgi:outer membrane biogenesis lipoprotein LolB